MAINARVAANTTETTRLCEIPWWWQLKESLVSPRRLARKLPITQPPMAMPRGADVSALVGPVETVSTKERNLEVEPCGLGTVKGTNYVPAGV